MQSRSERRHRERRNRIISAIVLVLIVGASPWWSQAVADVLSRKLIACHNHFRVNRIVVTGTNLLPEATVIDLAKIPTRQSIFRISFRDIEKRLAKNPWIKTAEARRRLPDTVELKITERVPVAAVRGNNLMVLTADSMAIKPPPDNWVWDLPLLSPPRAARLESGMRVKDEAVLALLQQAARVHAVSPELWKNISELYYRQNQICGILARPCAEINAGKGISELAWIGLENFLRQAELDSSRDLLTLDLRVPGRVIMSREEKETVEHEAG